jgi:hypothetical protein
MQEGAAMDYLALIEYEQQSTIEQITKGFYPVGTVSLLDGIHQIISGTWQGIGLLETLPEQQAIWGQQVLIIEPGKDRHRLQVQFTGTMIFEPKEFLDIMERWPGTEGLVRAKRAVFGHIAGGAA